MDYKRTYDTLIERALIRPDPTGYTENHHIIPKCMGGKDLPENMVRLTAREHFLAHRLLAKIYPGDRGLSVAVFLMACQAVRVNSRVYQQLREAHGQAISQMLMGNTRCLGRVYNTETKAKMSAAAMGNTAHLGMKHTAEAKAKMSARLKARGGPSAETKAKISATLKGRKHTAEHKAKLSAAAKGRAGKKHTDETKAKMSKAHTGKKMSAEAKAKISAYQTKRREDKAKASGSIVLP